MLAVDAGVAHLKSFDSKLTKLLSIGDGDSAQSPMDIEFPSKKDQSDLACALAWIDKNISEDFIIYLYGANGGRADHQLAVYGEINLFLQRNKRCLYLENRNHKQLYRACRNESTFTHNGQFSLFTLEKAFVQISGQIAYPLEKTQIPTLSSQCLSNEAFGEFSIDSDKIYFVFFNYD